MGVPTIHVRRGRWRDWGGGYTKHVEDLASQMGRVCTAGTADPSYHAGPALTGEANSLPSYSVTVMSRRRSSNNSPELCA